LQMHGSAPQNLETKVLLAGVLNTPSYGAGVCLAPDASTDDGKLDLVLLEDLRVAEILALLPALMSRGALNTNRVRRFRVESLRIETDKPCWFHGDGELLGMTPVEIKVVPKAFRVLSADRKTVR
jgi:diacylglycerol kinase (ATP)